MIGSAPAFWSRRTSLASLLLSPVGCIVGAITLRRMKGPSQIVPVPVLCIGNPTVGGAGKTPTALALLARLSRQGHAPFALLRGHGGSLPGPVRVVPDRHDAVAVGDEALLLAAAAPTIVSRDRPSGARLAVAEGASVILMDDGFQNPSLAKDVSVLVIDGAAGVGNGRVLPAGPLRAPLAPQLAAADAVLVVGDGAAGEAVAAQAARMGKAVLHGTVRPDPQVVAALRGRRVLAFAGIGRPDKLATTLRTADVEVAGLRAFPDHHAYVPDEIAALAAEAERIGAMLVTTSKDMARLRAPAFAAHRPAIIVLPIEMEIGPQATLDDLLALAFTRAARRSLQPA
ncbi:tetraacyldisaccharide 4'-kinase [Azorhizobium doebereinerae]|uniref:tetraacyldisaccharide 4'-kinase n=1 Tax=Azorhizobium doebereinerae TaxID=281091 RepID=UPI0003F6558C|nr:tetraacyldisaccharide 4'-kinase [Azorhizobium doebereinerae]